MCSSATSLVAAVARAARAQPAQRRRTDVPQELEQDSPARAHELPLVGCGVAEQEIWCGRRDVLQQEGVDRTRERLDELEHMVVVVVLEVPEGAHRRRARTRARWRRCG